MIGLLEIIIWLFSLPLILLPPGFLWARVLLPDSSIREQIALAPGISLVMLVLSAFLLWGPFGMGIDLGGAILVYLTTILPALSILALKNRTQLKVLVSTYVSHTAWITILHDIPKKIRREHLILVSVIGFAAVLTFQPHMSSPYPLHTDEWHYIIRGKNLVRTGDLLGTLWSFPETGYLTFLIMLRTFTDTSWFTLSLLLPTVMFSYALVLFYLLGKRHGSGHLAIFPLLLIPTTARYLGPSLMVPVALFLVTLPLTLFVIMDKRPRSLFLLALILVFQLLVHPPSAMALFLVVLAAAIAILRMNLKRSLTIFGILGCFFLPFIFPMEMWVSRLNWNIITEQGHFFLPPPGFFGYLSVIGVMLLFLSLLGAVHSIKIKKHLGMIVLLSLGALILLILAFVLVFPGFNNVTALHDRALFCLIVVLTIPAGFGIKALKRINFRLAFVTIAVMLILGTNIHFQAEYYHIVTDREYEDFIWIRDNLNESYGKAILDPWLAIGFRGITGKSVQYSLPQGPSPDYETRMREVETFFAENCQDSSFLARKNIAIIYTDGVCSNPGFTLVHDRVYVRNL